MCGLEQAMRTGKSQDTCVQYSFCTCTRASDILSRLLMNCSLFSKKLTEGEVTFFLAAFPASPRTRMSLISLFFYSKYLHTKT